MDDVIKKALLRASQIDCGKGESGKRQKMYAALNAVAAEAKLSPSVQLQLRCNLQLFDTRIPKRKSGAEKRSIN